MPVTTPSGKVQSVPDALIPLILEKKAELDTLCQKYRVKRLELFGSAARGQFDLQSSDLDFLIEFLPLPPGQRFTAYFDLLDDLRTLFGRDVDLVMIKAVSNPYFLRAIEPSRTLLYAA